MANSTLTAMTSASALTGAELLYTVQGGADRKVTSSQIYTYVTSVSTIGGSPGGVSGNLQYNSSGTFSGVLNSSWDATNSIFSLPANTLTVSSTAVVAVEKFRIDGSGLITNGGPNIIIGPSGNCLVEVFGDGTSFSGQGQIALGNNNSGLGFVAAKTRGTTPSSNVIVQVGDNLGALISLGNDGTGYQRGSGIFFDVDAAPGVGSMPTNIRLLTVSSGSVIRTERARLDSIGNLTVGSGSSNIQIQTTDVRFEVVTDANPWQFGVITTGNTAGVGGWVAAKTRGTVGSSQVIVQNADRMLLLEAAGSDGVTYQNAARIQAWVDGVPGVNSMPGRWTFDTTPSGSIASVERMRIDSNGNITNGFATFAMQNTGFFPKALMAQTDGSPTYSGAAFGDPINVTFGAGVLLAASRNTTVGSHTILQNGDPIGYFQFNGSDGTAFRRAAYVQAEVDGAPGASNMPGRLVFGTSPSGSITPVERLRISNQGNITHSIGATAGAPVGSVFGLIPNANFLDRTGSGNPWVSFSGWTNAVGGPYISFDHSRGTTFGTQVIVQNGDDIGAIIFSGSDGAVLQRATQISGKVDGVPSAGVMPGRLIFSTVNTTTLVERVRVDNTGNTWLMNATVTPATPTGAKANLNGVAANFAHASYGGI